MTKERINAEDSSRNLERRQHRLKGIAKIAEQMQPVDFDKFIATICWNTGMSLAKARECVKILEIVEVISIDSNGMIHVKKKNGEMENDLKSEPSSNP